MNISSSQPVTFRIVIQYPLRLACNVKGILHNVPSSAYSAWLTIYTCICISFSMTKIDNGYLGFSSDLVHPSGAIYCQRPTAPVYTPAFLLHSMPFWSCIAQLHRQQTGKVAVELPVYTLDTRILPFQIRFSVPGGCNWHSLRMT